MNDYANAVETTAELDTKLQIAASNISSNYADLVSLSLRQVMGTMDITIKKDSDNNWNTSDIKIFMKNIGGVGGGGYVSSYYSVLNALGIDFIVNQYHRVNSVDVLYSAFPAILYINATWTSYILSPLLESQDSEFSTQSFALQDIGE